MGQPDTELGGPEGFYEAAHVVLSTPGTKISHLQPLKGQHKHLLEFGGQILFVMSDKDVELSGIVIANLFPWAFRGSSNRQGPGLVAWD